MTGSTLCPSNRIENVTRPVGRAMPAPAMNLAAPFPAGTPELRVFPTISSCHRAKVWLKLSDYWTKLVPSTPMRSWRLPGSQLRTANVSCGKGWPSLLWA